MEKDKTSITSDIGMEFVDPRTQNTLFSTDYETHEFHLPNGVKILNVQKASTERVCHFELLKLFLKGNYWIALVVEQGKKYYFQAYLQIWLEMQLWKRYWC